MRVDVSPLQADLNPGMSQSIFISISNTRTIIGGYAIRVLGADPTWVHLEANSISLFPDETRALELVVDPPRGLPAGSRRIAVQIRELTPPYATTITEIDLTVPAAPQVLLRADPIVVTAGKQATFSLLVENAGNTDVRALLSGDDPEARVHFTFEPERIVLAPGQHTVVDMRARAKRRIFGTPTVRTLSVYMDPIAEDAFFRPNLPTVVATEERAALAGATFVQKSVMARGALSLVGLLFAATVFAIVITIALSRLVAQSTADRDLALQVAAARNSASATGTSGFSGTVTLLTSGKPVAGVAVSVFSSADTSVAVATTATDAKGAYGFTQLPAGQYKASFRGAGFVQVFYPGAASESDATTITLVTGQIKGGLDVSLGGVPSSISGSINGDDVSAATLFLETVPSGAAPASGHDHRLTVASPSVPVTPPDNGGAVVQQVPIGSDGSFILQNVPSPSVYDLVVVKSGYTTSTQRIDIGAGEKRTGVQITLNKGDGLISGVITASSGPLGAVTVTATAGQSTDNTVSLTGTGAFTLRDLPTPATFTLVAALRGYASQTLTLSLASGQKLAGVDITLSKSSASLSGLVTLLPDNKPVGGVGVTITNGELTVATVTESTAHVGAWQAGGLPIPGTYSLTFARSDLQSETISVSLDSAGKVTPGSVGTQVGSRGITVSMQSATATVSGTITQVGAGTVCNQATGALGEATVSMSSGSSIYSVTSASVTPNCGRYELAQIPPGTYTLTVSASSGTTPSSRVLTVSAGQSLTQNVTLKRPASVSGSVICCSIGSDAQPGPRGGWSVFLYLEAQYPNKITATTRTAADGAFTLADIDAGQYIIAVGPTGDPSNAIATKQVTVQPSTARTGVRIVVSQ